jgi:hypothetical protein
MPKGVYEHKRKYPKTNGYCVYVHSMLGLDYFGSTGDDLSKRWNPSDYKTTTLQPYIEMVGWDNIEHRVIKDGLTEDEVIELENKLIKTGWEFGTCINKQLAKKQKEYSKQYYKSHRKERIEYSKKYYETHRKERIEYSRQYKLKHKIK